MVLGSWYEKFMVVSSVVCPMVELYAQNAVENCDTKLKYPNTKFAQKIKKL